MTNETKACRVAVAEGGEGECAGCRVGGRCLGDCVGCESGAPVVRTLDVIDHDGNVYPDTRYCEDCLWLCEQGHGDVRPVGMSNPYDLIEEIAAMFDRTDSPLGEMARGMLARREAETTAPKERNDDEQPRS